MRNKLIYLWIIPLVCVACEQPIFKSKICALINVKNCVAHSVESINQFGGFGEGFILEIYEISEESAIEFINDPSKKLPDPEGDATWEKVNWLNSALDSSHIGLISMTLHYSNGNAELKKKLSKIEELIGANNVFHAFYCKPDLDNPQDTQLFVLDCNTRRMYVIESSI
jgi:hypothetical protein